MLNRQVKRVSIFIRDLSRGGSEKQALYLAKSLNPYYEVDVLIFYPEIHYGQFILENNINVIELHGSFLNKLIVLYNYLKKEKSTALFNYLPINNILGTIIGKLARIQLIFCGIRSAGLATSYYKLILQKYICNWFSDLIIANSYESLKKYGESGFDVKKIKVIHNCIEIPNEIKPRITRDYYNILTVSRFVEIKGVSIAIQAIGYLVGKHPEVRTKFKYNLVGYGILEKKLRKQILNLELEDVINIYDGTENITEFYSNADLYLSTSFSEGFSNSIMEALSYALPVVATDVGDNRYLVKEGVNGFLCRVNDYRMIAGALHHMISNENLIRRFSEKSMDIIQESYMENAFVQNYQRLLNHN
jgi:glycosyltransferase involved in cell wall biosynthesis